jgi:hypothetical protein
LDCTLYKCNKNRKNIDARNIAAGMSNHKNQQALTLKLKHSDGQVGLKSTEFLRAPPIHCRCRGKKKKIEKERLPRPEP